MKKTDRILRHILPEIEGKEVLEAACGTAEFSLSAAAYAKRITCIDIDESRLDRLVKERENICFRIMDASKMDFGDAVFDTIILYNALYHIKGQWDEILAECRRVLYCTPVEFAVQPDCRPPARYFPGGITVNPGGLQYKTRGTYIPDLHMETGSCPDEGEVRRHLWAGGRRAFCRGGACR